MSSPNWWGDWRPTLTPHTGNLQATDLIECTSIVGGLPVNTAITGAQIIAAASGGGATWGSITGTLSSQTDLQSALNAKQDTLVSATNIKTINGSSILGSGNLTISGSNIYNADGTLTAARTLTISSSLSLTIAGTTSSRFFGNGNVGIGTTTDAGFKLNVNGTARVQGDITSTAGIKSIVSSVTAQYNAYNPSNNYPRAQFQIGQNSSDVNIGLTISPLYSSTGVQKPCFIQVSTNKNISDTGQFSGYFIANTSIFTIGTNKQDGQVSGGLPIILAPAGTEAMRIFTNSNIAIGTTTDSGYKLDVAGTTRIQSKLSVGIPTATTAIMEITSTTQGFLPPRMTNAQMLAIITPAAGLVVYDTTNNKHCGYNGTAWQNFY